MKDHPTTPTPSAPKSKSTSSTAAKIWNAVSLLLTLAGICLMGVGGFIYLEQLFESGQPPPARIVQVTVDPHPVSTVTPVPSPSPTPVPATATPAAAVPASAPTKTRLIVDLPPPEVQADVVIEAPSSEAVAQAEPSTPVEANALVAEPEPSADDSLSLADNPLVVAEKEALPPAQAENPAPVVPPAPATPSTTDGTRLTRVVADSIGLDTEVIEVGWTQVVANGITSNVWVVADFAAGWHKNSALPRQGGNVVLSGHHNIKGEVFRDIVEIESGATVTLYDQTGQVFNYVVEDKFIVKDKGEPEAVRRENAKWIGPFNDERLTLVTCWPYNNNTHRVIVIAKPLGESQASQ